MSAEQFAHLSPAARRVQEVLTAGGFQCEVIELPTSTRTASEAARAVGCALGQIVKSLVFRGRESGRPILVEASGANRVDERRLGELVGEPIERADADFVKERTGFAIGGVPPVGHKEPLETFIDEDLLHYERVWAAAGTPSALFALTPAELQAMTGGRVVAIKQQL
ncbi:MAG: YbaK/EbsC family protein [Thermogemmatispora sp.]|jgi:prolyl-tRNA editing enzyme YbaK/EbsC (Cys-tRNA(Pro) deacylase)|uniref:Prolyl-tRNA editing protein n=1 Tax=Thermogemmatispora aurantia TaxID=2045279 RepID=A0A5J4KA30_9CHLR|nr:MULTISPECIES: YbaK/EbsC family protein [Thermogemmatispora]MBE3564168.1 YbaK/EbsC family protein [Thermogemmatispora sp.]MBX5452265.1 YbaK/EbsC family protein [Thermogemmatispora sp.]GER83599.1 prolyl-tRNA editing protein [Thermogemmatispora aurantia]